MIYATRPPQIEVVPGLCGTYKSGSGLLPLTHNAENSPSLLKYHLTTHFNNNAYISIELSGIPKWDDLYCRVSYLGVVNTVVS